MQCVCLPCPTDFSLLCCSIFALSLSPYAPSGLTQLSLAPMNVIYLCPRLLVPWPWSRSGLPGSNKNGSTNDLVSQRASRYSWWIKDVLGKHGSTSLTLTLLKMFSYPSFPHLPKKGWEPHESHSFSALSVGVRKTVITDFGSLGRCHFDSTENSSFLFAILAKPFAV